MGCPPEQWLGIRCADVPRNDVLKDLHRPFLSDERVWHGAVKPLALGKGGTTFHTGREERAFNA